jgi:virulence-associated protein VagC
MGILDIPRIFVNGRSQAVRLPKEFRFITQLNIARLPFLVVIGPF